MTVTDEIQQLISAGRFEYSLEKSNRYLRKAAELAQDSIRSSVPNYLFCLLGKEAYKELALNDTRPSNRTNLWLRSIGALTWFEAPEYHQYVSSYAELAVDICQDPFSDYPIPKRYALLKQAKNAINKFINETKDDEYKAICLVRKSAIMRLQAIGLPTEDRFQLLSEASRCSSKARGLSQHAAILLECALVEWALARLQKNDNKYVEKLQSAEKLLSLDVVKNYDLGPFALSRFYRLTYRYFDACVTYPQLIESTNRRRLLREVYIYAESAIQLSNLHYPSIMVEEHLNKAMNILEIALSSGCKSARAVIALAYIRCLKGGVTAGITALAELTPERGEFLWDQVLTMLSDAKESDLPTQGFALGITESSSLTRLGTLAHKFLKNIELTEALYRTAVRMDPHDPIAQTNLARFLVRRGEPADLREARRVIQLAQTFADRRFSWWRPVLMELGKHEGDKLTPTGGESESATNERRSFRGANNLRQIRQHYNRLKICKDEQYRGFELERLIYAISLLSCGFQRPSYRMERPLVGKIHQIDTHIEHRGRSYRCECKWKKEKVSYGDIVTFSDKIDVVGVAGLFISMSGFAETAVNKSKELRLRVAIILIDGEEVDLVMTGALHFDDLLNAKRRAFDSSSETYYRVSVSPVDG